MPNRILRDWTDSYSINELDALAERFFVRLIMKVDDFGRFHADPRLLKANLFPLLPEIRDTDISRWTAACEKSGLIRCYVDARGRQFLEIQNFRQRTRQSESKFPGPMDGTTIPATSQAGESPPIDSQIDDRPLTVNRQSSAGQLRTETETYSETNNAQTRAGSFGGVESVQGGGMTPIQQLGEKLQDLFPALAANRPQLEKVFGALRARKWTAETLDGWRAWYRHGWPRSQMSHFNLLNTLNDYTETHSNGNGAATKRQYCGNCVGGWLRPNSAQGETRARRCDCVRGVR